MKRKRAVAPAVTDPAVAARMAGLRYVADTTPGITRVRRGRGFHYTDAHGRPVRTPDELRRIRALAIPPAWVDVWICPSAQGHLQACGRDAKGRKQYRYHPRWRTARDETKYNRMLAFAAALPRIRETVGRDLAEPGLSRRKVLATVVRLLETTRLRVGNAEYAKANGSFGLTTLRNRHVDVTGATLRFEFRGKGGKMQTVDIRDPRLARIVRRCQELPGHELFRYVGDDGTAQTIGSADVNEYLREISADEFTAKDFRTWAGTVLAACALSDAGAFESSRRAKRNVVAAIARVAGELGNTPAICRKSYVHPAVIAAYLDGVTLRIGKRRPDRPTNGPYGLTAAEAAVVRLLRRRAVGALPAARAA